MRKRLHDLDLAAYRRIALSDSPEWRDRGWAHFTHAADHSKLWFATAAVLAARGGRPGRRAALRGVLSVGIASAVANQVGKRIFYRKRPDYLTLVEVARLPHRHPVSGSFPSGHSASAAAFAVGAASELPALALPLGAAAAAVGYSRVHTGVHYPGDVLAGWALGAGLGLATRWWWPLAPVDPAVVRERLAATSTSPAPGGRGMTIVVNAAAGGSEDESAGAIRTALPEADVVPLDDPEQLGKTLEHAAPGATAIGVHGGDGSVNAAAEVAYEAGRPLAVFPGGTLNHLARDLGIASIDDVARGVEQGCTVEMDVAEIDGRPFVNTASFGSYAELVDARERLESRVGKWPALVAALVTVLRAREPVEVEIDGRARRIWAIFIGNCRYQPAGFAPASRPRLDDGLLDVRVVDATCPLARTRLVLAVLTGTLARSRVYEQRFAREVSVRSAGPIRLARDGETFDGSRSFTVRKRARRLRVYVPPA